MTAYNISLKRDISPTGIGVRQSDQLNVRARTRLSQRLTGTLRVQAFNTKTLEGDISSVDRTYYSVRPGLRWAMTRNWSVDGSYRYRRQKRELDSDAADDNSVFVSFNYDWPKITVSR